MVYSHST
jgi:hypothetical protein